MIQEKKEKNVEDVMNQNIFDKFMNSNTKMVFEKYEKIFNKKILKKLNKFDLKSLENNSLFLKFFESFSDLAKINSKIYSKLKHECYSLSSQLQNISKTINNISDLFKSAIKNQCKMYEEYQYNMEEESVQLSKDILTGLDQWNTECISQKFIITENMASLFHYKKHEMLSLGELCQSKIKLNNSIQKQIDMLTKNK